MRFILASLSLGFFSWLAFIVLTDRLTAYAEGTPKSRAVVEIIMRSTESLGVPGTALALLALGAVLSFGIIAFGPHAES